MNEAMHVRPLLDMSSGMSAFRDAVFFFGGGGGVVLFFFQGMLVSQNILQENQALQGGAT